MFIRGEGNMAKKPAKRCIVCGQMKKLPMRSRMCNPCRSLTPDERKEKRSHRKPKGSVYTVSGGLPSLGKRR